MKIFGILLIFGLAEILKSEDCIGFDNFYCFVFFTGVSPFTEAELSCKQMGGHLASLGDKRANHFVGDSAAIYGINRFWIGADNLNNPDKWEWTDGSEFEFTNWAPEEPVDLPNFHCIYMESSTYYWYTSDCFQNESFVCKIPTTAYSALPTNGQASSTVTLSIASSSATSTEKTSSMGSTLAPSTGAPTGNTIPSTTPLVNPTDPPQSTTVPPITSTPTVTEPPASTIPTGNSCDPGWVYFEGTHSCYKNTTQKYSLDDAEKACVSMGAKLASVENAAEYGFFNSTMQYFWYWIGLCSTDGSKTWNWIDGKAFTYKKWCTNAPFAQSISCAVTNPSLYCFTNMQKSSLTYGMCKKPAAKRIRNQKFNLLH